MMTYTEKLLENCLFFTTNRLARILTKIAEEAFSGIELPPTHAFLLLAIIENPGMTQKEAGAILHMMPSTITRFLDKLDEKKLITRTVDGRKSLLYPTKEALGLEMSMKEAWQDLHERYSAILGFDEAQILSKQLFQMSDHIEAQ